MKKTRWFNTDFWRDPVLRQMTGDERSFYQYLLINPETNNIGIYQISKMQMAFDQDRTIEEVDNLMDRFINCYELIKYNSDTQEIAIKDWAKYTKHEDRDLVIEEILSDIIDVKDQFLISFVEDTIIKDDSRSLHDLFFDYSMPELFANEG